MKNHVRLFGLLFLAANFAVAEPEPLEIIEDNQPKLAEPTIIRTELPQEALPQPITRLLGKYKINPANISIFIKDVNADVPLLVHQANTLRSPASTMKLVTTYAALKELGPAYSWQTEAWRRGSLENGVLDGDLLIKGYGDPFLVHERYWKFVHDLKSKGLQVIRGDVVIDNHYFDLPSIDPGAFDNEPHRVYNAPPSALMFNFQATRFLFQPADDEQRVSVTPFPLNPELMLDNQLRLLQGGCRKSHYRPKFKETVDSQLKVSGSYSRRCGQQYILRHVTSPDKHAFYAFRQFWLELGGSLQGQMKTGELNRETDELLHRYSSPTLGEQIRLINKWSNNVMTRQLLLTLGAKRYGAPATLEKGRAAISDVLNEIGVSRADEIFIENGSGLSRDSRITANQMGHMLEVAYRDKYMPEFLSSLALSGIDGTMHSRFDGEDMEGRSHLKTGALRDVTAIAGYMLNRQGRRFVVVMQHNGRDVNKGRGVALQNAILRWVFEQ